MGTAYRLEGVVKSYGAEEVCRVGHLEVPAGSITVVMGPSGAGKSTLLRIMGLLEPPTGGDITVLGDMCSNGDRPSLALRRRITMVFQTPILFAGSVAQNVQYGLKVRGERDIDERVERALKMVGIDEKFNAKASTLSTGEGQRLALARALAIEPEILLLDEPTANLDPRNVAIVEDLITRAVRERGTTVVLVTQNVFQAKRLAQDVVFMLDGNLVESGPASKMFDNPDNPHTGAFVRGEMVY